jgi:hypothetical protein
VQPYFTVYLLLLPLVRLAGVMTACRVLYTGYVVAMAASFLSLIRALHGVEGERKTPWTALFGALLPWNPVQCVGFLPFMLALPAVLLGASAVVRASRLGVRRSWPIAVLGCVAATSLHFVAGGALVAFAWLFALVCATRRAVRGAFLVTLGTVGTILAWHAVGERGLEEIPTEALVTGIREQGLKAGIVDTLGVMWTPVSTKWSFVVATVLGPLNRGAKAAIGSAIVGLILVLLLSKRPASPGREGPLRFAVAVVLFGLLVVICPTKVRVPDDICLLDFRLYVLVFMLLVACVVPRWLEPLTARAGVLAFSVFVLGVWAWALHGAASEASPVVRLLRKVPRGATVLALPFHDRSEFLDEENTVTHYFPVYYTAIHGGVTSSFWGKFSHHLPVGFAPGREPPRPPDWDPAQVTRDELLAAGSVLVEWPDADDGDRRMHGSQRLAGELAYGFRQIGCEGRWCLFEQTPEVTGPEEALR